MKSRARKNVEHRGYHFKDAQQAVDCWMEEFDLFLAQKRGPKKVPDAGMRKLLSRATPRNNSAPEETEDSANPSKPSPQSLIRFETGDYLKFAEFFGQRAGHAEGFGSIPAMIHEAQQTPSGRKRTWLKTDYPPQEEAALQAQREKEIPSDLRPYKTAVQFMLARVRGGRPLAHWMNDHHIEPNQQRYMIPYINDTAPPNTDLKKMEYLKSFAQCIAEDLGKPELADLDVLFAEAHRRSSYYFEMRGIEPPRQSGGQGKG